MFKKIKELFSVDDENDLVFDTEDEKENTSFNPYQPGVDSNTSTLTSSLNGINFKEVEPTNTQGIDLSGTGPLLKDNVIIEPILPKVDETVDNELSQEIKTVIETTPVKKERPLAAKAAESIKADEEAKKKKAEAKVEVKVEPKKVEVKTETTTTPVKKKKYSPKDLDELNSKENFVLKDIIKPVSGEVVKKADQTILKEEKPVKPLTTTGIIKLRDTIKYTEVDPVKEEEVKEEEPKIEKVATPLDKEFKNLKETKDKKEAAAIKANEKVKKAASQNRFIIVEESTGELMIDVAEDEE